MTTSTSSVAPSPSELMNAGQEKQQRKSVKWQVEDECPPERLGPWKAPRRKKKSNRSSRSRRKSDTDISHCKAWNKSNLVSETSAEDSPFAAGRQRSRRSSLLGSFSRWAAANDSTKTRRGSEPDGLISADRTARRESIIKNVEGRRRSLLGSFYTAKCNETEKTLNSNADATPAKPSRRGSILNGEGRRRSLLGSVSTAQTNDSSNCENNTGRRRSILGSFSPVKSNESLDREKPPPKQGRRRSFLMGLMFPNSVPAKPYRRGSILDGEGRRRSLLGSVSTAQTNDSSNRENNTGRRRSILGSFSLL
jgi:hypothetical protein